MYTFVCTDKPEHASYSASKTQKDSGCPVLVHGKQCGKPIIEVRGLNKHPLDSEAQGDRS